MIQLLARLIRARTHNPGGDEPALARLLAGELSTRRPDEVVVETVDRQGRPGEGAYVFARWGTPKLLLNVHLDTVPPNAGWTGDPFEPRIDSERIVGLGAADTKGAMAAILRALDEGAPKDTAILFSGDEELGGTCIRAFVQSGRTKGIERAIVCEPTSCRAGVRHRGVLGIEATLTGKGGHSSRADTMPAPLAELARLAVAWADWGRALVDVGPEGFRGMCLNIAKLDGGIAFNVIPEEGKLQVSVRPPPGRDVPSVEAELMAIARTVVPAARLSTFIGNPSFETRSLEQFAPLLGSVVEQPVDLAFWTEAAVLAAAGIDAVVVGPGDIAHAHAPDEHVPIADLERARAVFVELFRGTH
jgi:acetylornithine deacetylase